MKRVFFLTREWSALKRLVRGQTSEPEGMPSVYMPWLQYRARGYDVHVFMVGDFKQRDIVDFKGCKIHLVPFAIIPFTGWGIFKRRHLGVIDSIYLYFAAASYGSKHPPDVIYSLREDAAYAIWALSKRFGAVCVKRIYGTFLYSYWFLLKDLRKRILSVRLFAMWQWPCDLIVITNDGTSGRKVADYLRIPKRKYRFWINGINKDWLGKKLDWSDMRTEIGLADGDHMLLTLGRVADWKRHDRAIRAMPRILEKVPNAKLVIAGDGPLRSDMERLVDELGVQEHVIFLGMVAHSKVRQLMSATDVFILPYDLTCLCNTLLEAQICGAPTVTWDIGETRDIVTDGANGRLLANIDEPHLSEAVIDLLLSPEKRKAFSDAASKFAKEKLQTWPDRMKMEIDLVEEILDKKRPTH